MYLGHSKAERYRERRKEKAGGGGESCNLSNRGSFWGISCAFREAQQKHWFLQGPCHVDPSRLTVSTFKEKRRTLAQNF